MTITVWRRALLLTLVVFLLMTPAASILYQHAHPAATPPPPVWPLPEDATEARKARMINALLPIIQRLNNELLAKRSRLAHLQARIQAGKTLRHKDQEWVDGLARRYRIPEDHDTGRTLALLIRRVDIIPADMALAQAAMESAWGTSRFSTRANNYFGQWCFKSGCGIVPHRRPNGAVYEVARFDSPEDSVRAYMLNLNSHQRYRDLRLSRERMRASGTAPDGYTLAAGLIGYSTIGKQYVQSIRGLIRSNDLNRFADPS